MITKTFTAFKVDIPSDYVMKHDRNYFKFYNFIEMGGIVKFEINKLGETAKKSFQFKVKTSEIVVDINDYLVFPTAAETREWLQVTMTYNGESYETFNLFTILGKTYEYPSVYSLTNKVVPVYNGKIHLFTRTAGYIITSRNRRSIPKGYSALDVTQNYELLSEPFFFSTIQSTSYNPNITVDSSTRFRYRLRQVCRHNDKSLMLSFIDRFGILRYEECFLTSSSNEMASVAYPLRNDYAVKDFPANVVTNINKKIQLTFPNITRDAQLEDILLCEGVKLHLTNGDTSFFPLLPADGEIAVSDEPQDITLNFKIIQ